MFTIIHYGQKNWRVRDIIGLIFSKFVSGMNTSKRCANNIKLNQLILNSIHFILSVLLYRSLKIITSLDITRKIFINEIGDRQHRYIIYIVILNYARFQLSGHFLNGSKHKGPRSTETFFGAYVSNN